EQVRCALADRPFTFRSGFSLIGAATFKVSAASPTLDLRSTFMRCYRASTTSTSAFRMHTQRQCSMRPRVYGLRVVPYDDVANTAEVPFCMHAKQRGSSSRRTYHTCAAKTKIASGSWPGSRSCWRATRTSSALSLRPHLSKI
ncbi:hypothetical protein K525DRAFT_206190, partial [Schizophyllum commune Loenen D]